MGWSFVPETFQALAINPEHLESYWGYYQRIMATGRVDRRTKEIIAVAVSALNDCGLCVRFHMDIAKRLGVTDEEMAEIIEVTAEVRQVQRDHVGGVRPIHGNQNVVTAGEFRQALEGGGQTGARGHVADDDQARPALVDGHRVADVSPCIFNVLKMKLEPIRGCPHQILSP
jgi:AhpD family alkylhydroperoxidase